MKILWVELNKSESLSIYPNSYGGAGQPPRWIKQDPSINFIILAPEECYRDYEPEVDYTNGSLDFSENEVELIRNGKALSDFGFQNVDIVAHSNPGLYLNLGSLKAKQVVWAVGQYETIHPSHRYLLLHNSKNQHPQLSSNPKIYDVILGVPIPDFKEYDKKCQVCQVSNHYNQINTQIMASLCIKHNIPFKFAGPVDKGYDIPTKPGLVDYLGIISEYDKINLFKESSFYSCLHSHPINETPLSAKQAVSYNCALLTLGAGHLGEIVQHGLNGFIFNSEETFIESWNKRASIKQENCYNSIRRYSVENMVDSFKKAFENICLNT